MDKNINQINKEIRSGRMLEENIPKIFNQLSDHYTTYAGVRLAMHYFAFYEAYCDDENTRSKDALELTIRLNNIIKDNILESKSGVNREEALSAVDTLRKEIMKRMDALTAYTDIFQTYEYVLNRLEYRFKEEVTSFNEEEFAKEILRYIFNSEDNLIINEKIKEIIGQLPIRITKQKYFELLKGSIQAYLGADLSSLDSYLYMLKTSAMLYHEEGMEKLYPGLWEKKELLAQLDYKDFTKESYDKALSSLQAATITLEIETTVYFSLQEIINEVYALLLCSPYAGMVPSEADNAKETARNILQEINHYFILNEKKELSMDQMEKFTDIEGVQEELSYEISTMEDALYEVNTTHRPLAQSLMLESLLHVLLRTKDLLSSSLFIDLESEKAESVVVDEERAEKEVKLLEEELSDLFHKHDKVISRAVMANTLNKMPVFFIDHKEVMDYVLYSLERCSDIYEKAACFEIINEIMTD
ncbi:MAG TPA: hypothetical protein VN258_12825 [Mobilitalea sp.]|nr:hypothetical protein [Mobilitalea sp.]